MRKGKLQQSVLVRSVFKMLGQKERTQQGRRSDAGYRHLQEKRRRRCFRVRRCW